jgi:hypothetical protein
MGAKKDLDTIDINDWDEVADFAKSSGVKPIDLFNYTIRNKGHTIKTKPETMRIGCLIYDTLQKKSKLKPRARILNLRKKIVAINPKYKSFTDKQFYENAYLALNRTPKVVLFDEKVRKRIL